jgi:hypothetical protein
MYAALSWRAGEEGGIALRSCSPDCVILLLATVEASVAGVAGFWPVRGVVPWSYDVDIASRSVSLTLY